MSKTATNTDGTDAQETNADRVLTNLITSGCSPSQSLDFYMVEVQGWTPEQWAMMRDVTPRAVERNIEFAEEVLDG